MFLVHEHNRQTVQLDTYWWFEEQKDAWAFFCKRVVEHGFRPVGENVPLPDFPRRVDYEDDDYIICTELFEEGKCVQAEGMS